MYEKQDMLKLFFENLSKDYSVREAGRLLKMSPSTASKLLKSIAKEGLLIEQKERIYLLYKANLDNPEFRELKKGYNLRKLRDSGLIDALNKYYLKPTLVLFGSFSTGYDTETSDIDLIVISEKTKEFIERRLYEQKLGHRIQMFVVKDINELKNKHLINNVLNGTLLQGAIKWT
jgi:predicted nucleotidyltransferase